MTDWNLAECLDTVAELRGERAALIQGDRTISWKSFDLHAQRIATWLHESGVEARHQVGLYAYNDVAYLETSYACLKASFFPVNINYRYKESELLYLFDNSDAQAALVHVDFLELFIAILPSLPKIKAVLLFGEGVNIVASDWPDNVTVSSYEKIIETAMAPPPNRRSGDDLVFIYTGGTTGMPKGVMWHQRDLYENLAGGTVIPPPPGREEYIQFILDEPYGLKVLILPPLMHGTAFFASIVALLAGGTVVLTENYTKFDTVEVLTTVERTRPNVLSIVGDTFGRPLLEELRRNSYDISSLELISSAGTLWSSKVKAGLLEFNDKLRLSDGLGSSEALNVGSSLTTIDNVGSPKPRFEFGTHTLIVDDEMNPLEIKPGTKGMIAVGGARPAGYYKDATKSDETFLKIDGRNCTLSGDWAEVNEDGKTFTLLGRGSVCINTGGEKVFPEEVEGAIKLYEGIVDAVVVGIPDDSWGEAVVGAISVTENADVDPDAIIAFVKTQLANYKAPKHIVKLPVIYRSPAGKADYAATKKSVMDVIGTD